MRKTALLLMIIACVVAVAIQMPLRAAAFSYTQRVVAASEDLSWLTPSECTVSDGFVEDERCAEPYDKRSVRRAVSLLGRGTSEMLNGCGWYISDVHRVGGIRIPTNAALIVGLHISTISDGKRL